MAETSAEAELWHRWLLDSRYGGDTTLREQMLSMTLYPVRDKILNPATVQPGDTLLDVGTGDGMIGFEALNRLGVSGRVVFSDMSEGLLDHCRARAREQGQLDRCSFLRSPAERLTAIPDHSVDIVTLRSVLVYVKNKAAALKEFYRVLRPGGRLSIFEPVDSPALNRRHAHLLFGYDVSPVADIASRVMRAIQQSGVDPVLGLDYNQLFKLAERAGFTEVDLELRVAIKPSRPPLPWDGFIRMAPYPKIPPLAEIMREALNPEEANALVSHLRPLVEGGICQDRTSGAYLCAST